MIYKIIDRNIRIKIEAQVFDYEVRIGAGDRNSAGLWARDCLGGAAIRIVVVSNKTVFDLYGDGVSKSLLEAGFETSNFLIGDGEEYKTLDSAQKLLDFLSENQIGRTDAIITLGGGVVGDLAAFAASIYLRGISFLQIPTTLLSMIDSSVGGKTGVNSSFGKNLIGTFFQPKGVLVDLETLRTLTNRDLSAGFYEAIKQGVIGGSDLLDLTKSFLDNYEIVRSSELFDNELFVSEFENLVAAQIEFKARIVSGDESESALRVDPKSRKILNFGHTVAHGLEKVTDYKYFRHGEAVGYGILVATEISTRLGLLSSADATIIEDAISDVGILPDASHIDIQILRREFDFDKKRIGESLQWILLEKIGKPKIVSGESISDTIIRDALTKLLKR